MADSGLISLNLAKLSTTTDVPPDASQQHYVWKHTYSDLVVVFDSFRSAGPRSRVMRITQATQVLYEVPVEEMVNEGREITDRLSLHGMEVKCDQLPISAIVKCPMLALRYSLRDQGKIRRIQLRFASSEEYDTAINHLRQLGLRMSAAQSAKSTPSVSPFRPQSGGPSFPPSHLAEISNRPLSALPAIAPSLQPQLQEAAVVRPMSAMLPLSGPLVPPVYFRRPDSASTSSSRNLFSDYSIVPDNPPTPTNTNRQDTALSSDRPNTSTSESYLPPRRELPFVRPDLPKSSGSDGVRPSSRSSSSIMGPPPLPPPSRAGSKRPSSKGANSHGTELSSLAKPTIVESIHATPQIRPSSGRGSSRGSDNASPSKPIITERKENQPLPSSPPPYRPGTTVTRPGTRPLSPPGAAQQNRQQNEPASVFLSPPASDATNQGQVRLSLGLCNAIAANATESLAEFTMQSEEGRMSALNNFILQHLDDDNFLALVEDMDVCWARIAPGLG